MNGINALIKGTAERSFALFCAHEETGWQSATGRGF